MGAPPDVHLASGGSMGLKAQLGRSPAPLCWEAPGDSKSTFPLQPALPASHPPTPLHQEEPGPSSVGSCQPEPGLGPLAPRAPWCLGPWCSRGESACPGAGLLSHAVTGTCQVPTQPVPSLPSPPQLHPDQLLLHLVTCIYGAPITLPRDRQAPPYEGETEEKPLRLQDAR